MQSSKRKYNMHNDKIDRFLVDDTSRSHNILYYDSYRDSKIVRSKIIDELNKFEVFGPYDTTSYIYPDQTYGGNADVEYPKTPGVYRTIGVYINGLPLGLAEEELYGVLFIIGGTYRTHMYFTSSDIFFAYTSEADYVPTSWKKISIDSTVVSLT